MIKLSLHITNAKLQRRGVNTYHSCSGIPFKVAEIDQVTVPPPAGRDLMNWRGSENTLWSMRLAQGWAEAMAMI
jgi:hypothetical protein